VTERSPVIRVQNLSKRYGKVQAVDDVSFEVGANEILGIIGPNGAGKTTTVECVLGLRVPSAGTIRVLGLDPQAHARELRLRIGMQLQQAALPEAIKVWEALDLFASFYPHALDAKALLEEWGLSEKRQASFASLSGGQKQRLFIALALVNDPEVVILDEITTGLDPQARRNTWEMIERMRERGKTVVLVTHYMDEAERLCDCVAVIDQGKLLALDTPRNLIQRMAAASRVRFHPPRGLDPTWLTGVAGVSRVAHELDEVVVYGSGTLLLNVAAALADRGVPSDDLRSQPPNLEDVFLALTGRKMRE